MPAIRIANNYRGFMLLRPAVEHIAHFIARQERRTYKGVTVIITDDKVLNDLKKRFFGEDAFTDTITFNYNSPGEAPEGEIYLSLDRIRENSQNYRTTFDQELITVLVHGFLHLLGYNDEQLADKKQMHALQNFYAQQIKLQRFYRHLKKSAQP